MSIPVKRASTARMPQADASNRRRGGTGVASPDLEDATSIWRREITFGPLWRGGDYLAFYSQLTRLLKAGLPLATAVEVLTEAAHPKHAGALARVLADLRGGGSLSEALGHVDAPAFVTSTIAAGERTGSLAACLSSVEAIYARRARYSRSIRKALVYPTFVLALATAVVLFIMYFVVPMFADMYDRLGGRLPPITVAIQTASAFLVDYGWALLAGVVVVGGGVYLAARRYLGERITDLLVAYVPGVGTLVRDVEVARFASTMSLLLGSGIRADGALTSARSIVRSKQVASALAIATDDIAAGSSVTDALREFSFLRREELAMVGVGEVTNDLAGMFESIAEGADRRIDARIEVITGLMEPILIIFLGVVVGFILVAMYLPLFQLGSAVGN